MTDDHDNKAFIFTDADGLPEAVADVHQMQQAGVELAAQCALLGNNYEAIIDQIVEKVEEAGPAGAGVMMSALATLAQLFNANIHLIEKEGWAIREELRDLAAGKLIDVTQLPAEGRLPPGRPSRAERRKKRRR